MEPITFITGVKNEENTFYHHYPFSCLIIPLSCPGRRMHRADRGEKHHYRRFYPLCQDGRFYRQDKELAYEYLNLYTHAQAVTSLDTARRLLKTIKDQLWRGHKKVRAPAMKKK